MKRIKPMGYTALKIKPMLFRIRSLTPLQIIDTKMGVRMLEGGGKLIVDSYYPSPSERYVNKRIMKGIAGRTGIPYSTLKKIF